MRTLRSLELASLLTNEWSLASEVCEDMGIPVPRLGCIVVEAKTKGLNIDRELGKIRLSLDTSIDQVKLALTKSNPHDLHLNI